MTQMTAIMRVIDRHLVRTKNENENETLSVQNHFSSQIGKQTAECKFVLI